MKRSPLLRMLTLLSLGCLVTLAFSASAWAAPASKKSKLTPAKLCKHNGKLYKSGEAFPAGDGCNRCDCSNGTVRCTAMACLTCKYGGTVYKNQATFPSQDGCNRCTCKNGVVSCTKRACPSCKYNGKTYPSNTTFPSKDKCNQCLCLKGLVHCTKRTCTVCFHRKRAYQEGQSYAVFDGCNRCVCHKGQFFCSNKTCTRPCRVGKMVYKHKQNFSSKDGLRSCTCNNGRVSCKMRKPVFRTPPRIVKPPKAAAPGTNLCKDFYYKLCKKNSDCKAGYTCKDRSLDCRASICFCDKKTGKIGGCTLDCLRGFGFCKK